ncbi:MAG TPA: hypothetical protein VGR72_03045 [Candidatus Acidoferrales bacterium]|nr:hypothetical protein [Candidatus Acidoferrales bacterium]
MTGIQAKQTVSRKFARVLYFVFSILVLTIFMRWNLRAGQAKQTASDNFSRVLCASGRSPEIPESADAYGWLVGSWELQVLHYAGRDLSSQNIKGEAHFSWVLEGRAIQDVWIMPRISDRKSGAGPTNNMYGTTLRIWDPTIQAWHIRWLDPVIDYEERQTGRRVGNEIVQVGARSDGTPTRWRFTEITPNSFHWIGEALEPDGKTWRLEGEFRASRLP